VQVCMHGGVDVHGGVEEPRGGGPLRRPSAGCMQNTLTSTQSPLPHAHKSCASRPPETEWSTPILRTCTNLTLASMSDDNSMAWLNPFSPPA